MLLIREHWTKSDYDAFLTYLQQSSEESYQKFHQKILNSKEPIIGIRLPILRKYAKEICKGNAKEFLKYCSKNYHEEVLLHGLIITRLPMSYEEFQTEADNFIQKIQSWASCDTFCTSLKKPIRNHKQEFWNHLSLYLHSKNPWAVRVGLVAMLANYIEEPYIDKVISRCDKIKDDFYYVRMGQAWLISEACAKFPEKTIDYLRHHSTLDPWTYGKSIQKICESSRIPKETKDYLKTLKK
jgi:3-methyladenine DNA glycosylase AlkD